jgi:predicted dehydrogenase
MASLDPVERTDRYAMAILRFDGDVLAQLSCAVTLTEDDHIRIYGTDGHLHVPWPCWLGGRRDAASHIIVTRPGSEPEAIDIPGGENIFALEADGVAALLRDGVDACRPTWDDTLANMRTSTAGGQRSAPRALIRLAADHHTVDAGIALRLNVGV